MKKKPKQPISGGTKSGAKWLLTTFIVVVLLDVLTKEIIRELLPVGSSFAVTPWLSISHVQNIGIAFGLLQIPVLRWILVGIAIAIVLMICWSCKEKKLREHFVAWGLIAGGALGNALDRIFFGVVTDFINLHWWPAFNIADSALTIGVILLIWHSFRKE